MSKALLLSLFILIKFASAQTLEGLYNAVNSQIIEDSINENESLPAQHVLADAYLRGLTSYNESERQCDTGNQSKNKSEKDHEFRLVFLASLAPGMNSIDITENNHRIGVVYQFHQRFKDDPRLNQLSNLSANDLYQLANDLADEWPQGTSSLTGNNEQVSGQLQSQIFLNLILRGAADFYSPTHHNDFSDGGHRKITQWIGQNIQTHLKDENQVLEAIAMIKATLYENYNNPRNFTDEADSDNRYIGRQLAGLMNYMNNQQRNSDGGVCNDIAAIGCDIYNAIYPNKDCLVMNIAGAGVFHEVMVVGDGTGDYKVIDGGTVASVEGSRFLKSNPHSLRGESQEQAMFIRIQKVEDGNLKDLYVQKSEYGTFIDKLINGDEIIASTVNRDLDAQNYSEIMSKAIHEVYKNNREKMHAFEYGVGSTDMSDQTKVYAVYAKYKKQGKIGGLRASVAYSHSAKKLLESTSIGLTDEVFQSHFQSHRAHINISGFIDKLLYRDKNWSLSTNGFVDLNLMAGYTNFQSTVMERTLINGQTVTSSDYDLWSAPQGDGNLTTGLGVRARYQGDNTDLIFIGQQSMALGSQNYGGMHNFMQETGKALGNLTLVHQSLDLRLDARHKLGRKVSMVSESAYRGTNVGQFVKQNIGISVATKDDIEYVVYAGLLKEKSGYQTQQNWLSRPMQEGLTLGANARKGKVLELNAGVSHSLRQDGRVFFNVGARITPIQVKKKK